MEGEGRVHLGSGTHGQPASSRLVYTRVYQNMQQMFKLKNIIAVNQMSSLLLSSLLSEAVLKVHFWAGDLAQ